MVVKVLLGLLAYGVVMTVLLYAVLVNAGDLDDREE